MQPLKPGEVGNILKKLSPQSEEQVRAKIDRYQELLARRFTTDPDLASAPEAAIAREAADSELRSLRSELFDI